MPATKTDATTRRPNRSNEEWDKLAREVIVPALQAGTTMTELRAQYGAGVTIRRALARIGYNTKGQKMQVLRTTGSRPQVRAKRVAERREAGAPWWLLEMETEMSADALKADVAKYANAELASGRVIISRRGKARLAKAQALAEAKAAAPAKAKRVRKPRAKKEEVTNS